jgi:hypothetical protein
MTPEVIATLTDHAQGNLRGLMIMADELLAAAAERQAEKIDETLLFEACALAAQRRNRVKSGPRRNSNDIARWSNMKLPVKSAGSRSGVKLRPLELQAENLACLARAITVLATRNVFDQHLPVCEDRRKQNAQGLALARR